MAVREDLVNSAVTFLTDPNVADATLAKKVEFLESKNMTKEEIDEAMRRAESAPSAPSAANRAAAGALTQQMQVPAYPYSYNPPPIPERDWKDYFVMATVSVGVAYGLYEVARRYVLPMIMPPTPASLEADKAALEAEFSKTEALVEQLASDTEALKKSEEERSKTFDQVIKEAKQAIEAVRSQADERKQDLLMLKSHVEILQDLIPKSLEKHKESQDMALKDLQDELKSLKQLISNRTKASGVPPASSVPTSVTLPKKDSFVPQINPSATTSAPGSNATAPNSTPVPPSAPSAPSVGSSSSAEPVKQPSIPAWQRDMAK